jgi:hypothetical protein
MCNAHLRPPSAQFLVADVATRARLLTRPQLLTRISRPPAWRDIASLQARFLHPVSLDMT